MTVAFPIPVPMVAPTPIRQSQPRDVPLMTISPCIKVCTLDPVSGLCSGCGRTLAEIERWPRMSDAERLQVMAELDERLREMRRAAG